jgi:hypothetical protein
MLKAEWEKDVTRADHIWNNSPGRESIAFCSSVVHFYLPGLERHPSFVPSSYDVRCRFACPNLGCRLAVVVGYLQRKSETWVGVLRKCRVVFSKCLQTTIRKLWMLLRDHNVWVTGSKSTSRVRMWHEGVLHCVK